MNSSIRTFFYFIFLYLFSLFFHLLLLWELKSCPLFHQPEMDMLWHWEWANEIVNGNWLGEAKPFFRAPLYPYFLAGLILIFGKNLLTVRLGQALMGSLISPLSFYICQRLGLTFKTSLGTSILIALYPLLLFFDLELLMPVLIIPLNLLGLALLLRLKKDSPARSFFFPGLVFSFSLITRPDIIMLIPAVLVWSWLKFKEGKFSFWLQLNFWFALGFFLLVPLVFARNYLVGKEPVLISTQGGINFWIGNNPLSDGKTAMAPGPARGYGKYLDNVWLNSRLVAEEKTGRKLTEREISRYWFLEGIRFWREEPGMALGLLGRKIYFLLNGEEISCNQDFYYFRAESFLLKTLAWKKIIKFPFGLLLPVSLAGIFWGRKKGADFWLLTLFAFFFGAGIVLFFVNARFRLPLVPILFFLSALGISEAQAQFRKKNWQELTLGFVIFLTFIFISNSNFFGVSEYIRENNWIRAGTYYFEHGDYEKALRNYGTALKLNPNSVEAYTGLGAIALKMGRLKEALTFYLEAELRESANAQVQYNLGLVYQLLGEREEAEQRFERALSLYPDFEKAKEQLKWLREKKMP